MIQDTFKAHIYYRSQSNSFKALYPKWGLCAQENVK